MDGAAQIDAPQAIFLDVGWTLIYPRESLWETFAAIGREAGADLSADSVERLVYEMAAGSRERARTEFEAGTRYSDSDEEFSSLFAMMGQAVFGLAGIPGNHDELTTRFMERFWTGENWQVFPDVPDGLERLRRAGLRVGVLSNAASQLVEFLEQLDLARYCDFTVVSAIEGTKKPDRRIFEVALERAGVPAHRAVHVGDMLLEDVLGARNAGVLPLFMDRGELSMFPNHPDVGTLDAGVSIVRTLDDVAAAIGV